MSSNSTSKGFVHSIGDPPPVVPDPVSLLDSDPDLAFQLIFDRHHRSIYYFFVNRGFSDEECFDLTQETFLRAFKSLGAFRGESRLETWLFSIAKHVWQNRLRALKRNKRAGHEVSLDDSGAIPPDSAPRCDQADGPVEDLLGQERGQLLREALADLPSQMRRCVLLRLGQELKYREIAAIMRVSIDTVKSQLHQARQRLKRSLAEHFEDVGTL